LAPPPERRLPLTYSLSFAPAFFCGDGTVPLEKLPPSTRPMSVYLAMRNLSDESWAAIARDVFHVDPDYLDIETVLARIVETDTCCNLDPPVEVFIDPEGFHTVLVFDTPNP